MSCMPGEAAVARADLWALLARVLTFPSPELAQDLSAGRLRADLSRCVAGLPYPLRLPAALAGGHDDAGLEEAFISLFDAPASAKACPLYAAVYAPNRRDAMEEILRFYRHFGMTSAGSCDLPDSIPTMFEFLCLLAWAESQVQSAAQCEALARVQRDLLGRHLDRWGSATAERMASRKPHPFYAFAVALAAETIRSELAFLESRLAVPARSGAG